MGRLDGRVAFLTGAGRGIGAATAAKLAADGAAGAVTDMDLGPAEETAAAIRASGGRGSGRRAPGQGGEGRGRSASTLLGATRWKAPLSEPRPSSAGWTSWWCW